MRSAPTRAETRIRDATQLHGRSPRDAVCADIRAPALPALAPASAVTDLAAPQDESEQSAPAPRRDASFPERATARRGRVLALSELTPTAPLDDLHNCRGRAAPTSADSPKSSNPEAALRLLDRGRAANRDQVARNARGCSSLAAPPVAALISPEAGVWIDSPGGRDDDMQAGGSLRVRLGA